MHTYSFILIRTALYKGTLTYTLYRWVIHVILVPFQIEIMIWFDWLGADEVRAYAFTHNGRAIIASSNKFSNLYFTHQPFRALSFCHLDTSIQFPSQTTLSFAGPDLRVAQPLCLIVSQFMSS